jgi:hypothetical protein
VSDRQIPTIGGYAHPLDTPAIEELATRDIKFPSFGAKP